MTLGILAETMTDQNSDERQRQELLEYLRKTREIENLIVRLLATAQYEELERLGNGEGLSALEIERAFAMSGRTLCMKPKNTRRARVTVRRSQNAPKARRWSVTRELWTVEDFHPDLTLTYTVVETSTSERSINIERIELKDDGAA